MKLAFLKMSPLNSNRPRTIALLSPFSLTLVVREFQWLVGEHARGSRESLESLSQVDCIEIFNDFFCYIHANMFLSDSVNN